MKSWLEHKANKKRGINSKPQKSNVYHNIQQKKTGFIYKAPGTLQSSLEQKTYGVKYKNTTADNYIWNISICSKPTSKWQFSWSTWYSLEFALWLTNRATCSENVMNAVKLTICCALLLTFTPSYYVFSEVLKEHNWRLRSTLHCPLCHIINTSDSVSIPLSL